MFKTSTLKFRVENHRIIISCLMGWMTRPEIMLQMFQMYIDKRGIQTLPDITIDLSDACTDLDSFPNEKYFTISAPLEKKHLLLPDPYSLCWPEAHIDNVFEKCAQLATAGMTPPTDTRLFWIGQNSHWTRKVLVELADKHPDRIVASFLECKKGVIPKNEMVSLEDHTKYKYLIDLSGQGFSARIKYLLFSRRPLFIVERKYHDWISCDLKPWIHYIPVKDDKIEDDLLLKMEWADKNECEASLIAQRALEHISSVFTLNKVLNRIDEVMAEVFTTFATSDKHIA